MQHTAKFFFRGNTKNATRHRIVKQDRDRNQLIPSGDVCRMNSLATFVFLVAFFALKTNCIPERNNTGTARMKKHFRNHSHKMDHTRLQNTSSVDAKIRSFVKVYETVGLNISNSLRYEVDSATISIKFYAFKTKFNLILRRDRSVVSSGLNVYMGRSVWTGSQLSTMGLSSVYSGTVEGKEASYVYGKLSNGTFDGIIETDNDTLYLEPLSKYYRSAGGGKCIIYRKTDLLDQKQSIKLKSADSTERSFYETRRPTNYTRNKSRTKRDTVSSHSCSLHVIVDHTFYKAVSQSSRSQTIAEIVYLVGRADHIFRSTDFDGDGKGDNLGFTITAITIYPNETSDDYKMSSDRLTVYDYLNKFALYNFDDYCLGIAFSYRDFGDGVIGLAWIGNSDIYGPPGGICQARLSFSGELVSFNTALVSLLNFGSRIPSYRAALTLAHEFGHSFGSMHDDVGDNYCAPENEFGNYLMFPYASDGAKPNNIRFSSCSVSHIYPVIVNKGHCLRVETGPVCGNTIVEAGEECDCGTSTLCSLYGDECCVPSDVGAELDSPCTFRRRNGKMCSWKFSPCCDKQCTYISAIDGHKCAEATQCKQESFCDGNSAECPEGSFLLDGTTCDGGKKACKEGVCIESICESRGMQTCQCVQAEDEMCMLCCRSMNLTNCQPANTFGIFSASGRILYQDAGVTCHSSIGVCNHEHMCIRKSPNSIIRRLGKVFDEENIEDMKSWFTNYWYYIVLGLVGIVIFAFIFVVTKKKLDNTHIDAYRMGRFMRVTEEANLEKARQKKQFMELDSKYAVKIRKIKEGAEHREFTQAVSRLAHLFPTATTASISDMCRRCTSEDVAVRLLLVKGYPIRRLVTSNN